MKNEFKDQHNSIAHYKSVKNACSSLRKGVKMITRLSISYGTLKTNLATNIRGRYTSRYTPSQPKSH